MVVQCNTMDSLFTQLQQVSGKEQSLARRVKRRWHAIAMDTNQPSQRAAMSMLGQSGAILRGERNGPIYVLYIVADDYEMPACLESAAQRNALFGQTILIVAWNFFF